MSLNNIWRKKSIWSRDFILIWSLLCTLHFISSMFMRRNFLLTFSFVFLFAISTDKQIISSILLLIIFFSFWNFRINKDISSFVVFFLHFNNQRTWQQQQQLMFMKSYHIFSLIFHNNTNTKGRPMIGTMHHCFFFVVLFSFDTMI